MVEAHRGNVLELRGDEALVVFGSPRSAMRGAVALQQRFVEETIADPSLPLTVGIGLDAGEAVPLEGGYRGRALNVAARLCSLARAGEVLASREIVHLAARVDGIRFTERGPAELKGLDKPVHVVAVRSEDRDEAEAIAPFDRSTAPAPRRRWKAVAVVVAFAVLATLVAVPLIARDAEGRSEIAPNSIGVLDPESGEVTATVELEDRPGAVAASADAVWVTNPDDGTVTRIDPNAQEIRDTIQVGENPTGIAVGEEAVWVVDSGGPSVSRISPDTNEVVDTIEVGNGPAGIAVDEGSVWVTNRFDGTISRIDPDSGEVVEDDSSRARPSGDRGRVRQRVGGAGRLEPGCAPRPPDERGDAADRRGQRAGVIGRECGRRVGREHPRRHRVAKSAPIRIRSWTRSGSGMALRGSRSCKGSCGWRTKRTGRSRGSSPVKRPPGGWGSKASRRDSSA